MLYEVPYIEENSWEYIYLRKYDKKKVKRGGGINRAVGQIFGNCEKVERRRRNEGK